MDKHQRDEDAAELKDYFLNVISWVKKLFQYDKYMKGLPWGEYYNKFKSFEYDINELRSEVDRLMADWAEADRASRPQMGSHPHRVRAWMDSAVAVAAVRRAARAL